MAPMVVVFGERFDLGFEVTGQELTFKQGVVLEDLVPALNLAVGLGMLGRASQLLHAPVTEPFGQIARYIGGAIVAEQPGFVLDMGLVAA